MRHLYLYLLLLLSISFEQSVAQKSPSLIRNYAEWENANRAELRKADGKTIQGHKQFERANFMWDMCTDPSGNMFNYAAKNKEEYLQLKSSTQPTGSEWDFIGPHGPGNPSGAGIGRVNCIHVFDADTWFIGASGGGVWKTDNAGIYLPGVFDQPWENLTENFPCLSISGISVNPSNQNEIYVLTGDPFNIEQPSIGIYKTTDGGANWEVTDVEFGRNDIVYGYKLLSNPLNFLEMYACTSNGLLHTTDGWQTHETLIYEGVYDVELHPNDPSIVYSSTDDNIFKICCNSLNPDLIVSGIDILEIRRIELAVTAAMPDMLYAVCIDPDRSLGGIFMSLDQGENWLLNANGAYNLCASSDPEDPEDKGQGEYCMAFHASQNTPGKLYYGCVRLWSSALQGLTGSWGMISNGGIHADLHAIIENPFAGNLIACTDGGVYVSPDGGSSWESRNYGLHITEFYHVGVDNNWLATIESAGGAQDNGTIKSVVLDGTWDDEIIQGGDGFNVHINVMSDLGPEYYTETQNGKLYYTGYSGITLGTTTIYPEEQESGIESKDNRFDTPYEVNPYNFDELIIGYEDLYYSNNRGQGWTTLWNSSESISFEESFEISSVDFHNSATAGFVVEPKNSGSGFGTEIWVTTLLPALIFNQNPNFWRHWSHSELGITENQRVSDLSIRDYHGEGINYTSLALAIAGYDSLKKVLYLPNVQDEDSIINLTYDLPNVPVFCIEQLDEGIYVGTSLGVFYLPFGGTSWTNHSNGLPVVPVTEIEFKETLIDGKMMYISTYGRGMWRNFLAEAQPTRYFVDVDATGANDGSSWENAFNNLSTALNVAQPQDSLWIAEGIYLPGSQRTSNFSFNGEKVFGGFNGTETKVYQRNPSLHITRLSGDIGTSGLATDNVYRLITTNAEDNHCLFDGVVFSDGYANGAATDQKSGACLKVTTYVPGAQNIYPGKRPHFKNCTFENFYAQTLGGVFWYEDFTNSVYDGTEEIIEVPVIFDSCIFRNNYAQYGGAIYIDNYNVFAGNNYATTGNMNIDLTGCVFEFNDAQFGGAISVDAQDNFIERTFKGITFRGNTALDLGGAIRTVASKDGDLHCHFIDCLFESNTAGDDGGAIHNYCGTNNSNYDLPGHVDFSYENCTFTSNSSGSGGGAICDRMGGGDFDKGSSVGNFSNCTFTGNHSVYYGGAIYTDNSNNTSSGTYGFSDCTFTGNYIGGDGGTMKFDAQNNGICNVTMNNCTFLNSNAGAAGGAIYGEAFVNGDFSLTTDSCSFTNCAADNGGAIYLRSNTSGSGSVIVDFRNSQFDLNYANGAGNNSNGGAVFHYGGSSHVGSYKNCTFTGNHSNGRSGALGIQGSQLTFDDCGFSGNYCSNQGGAFYWEHNTGSVHSGTLNNCYFSDNSANSAGGAFFVSGSNSIALNLNWNNCEFSDNTSVDGGAINIQGGGTVNVVVDSCSFITNDSPGGGGDGAGLKINNKGSLLVKNSLFNGNVAGGLGGAMHITSYSGNLDVEVMDCIFQGGQAGTSGALHIVTDNFSSMTGSVHDCTFQSNQASSGVGAVGLFAFDACSFDIHDCSFLNNSSFSSASSTGALYCKSFSASDTCLVSITDCLFHQNSAVGAAGAIHCIGDGALKTTIDRCRFTENTSGFHGGAVRVYTLGTDYTKVNIKNSLFDMNTAGGKGGALMYEASTASAETLGTIDQCVISHNQGTEGGAVHVFANSAGAIANVEVRNSTLYGNIGTLKCGGFSGNRTNGTMTLQSNNNIIWANTDNDTELNEKQLYKSGTVSFTIRNSDILDGLNANVLDGGNNLNVLPAFINPNSIFGTDALWPTEDDGLRLLPESPCIDMANALYNTNQFDVTGAIRPQDQTFDMGPYEVAAASEPCLGDLNNDGYINTTDLLLFISAYGSSCSGCPADLTGDGFVNTSDLLVFVSTYGGVCP